MLSILASIPPVPADLVGRVAYAITYMPWGLVSLLTIAAVCMIGAAYVADPRTAVPRVVTCACGRRQATLAFACDARVDNTSFIAALTGTCPWCQADAEAKRTVGERIIHKRNAARRAT